MESKQVHKRDLYTRKGWVRCGTNESSKVKRRVEKCVGKGAAASGSLASLPGTDRGHEGPGGAFPP